MFNLLSYSGLATKIRAMGSNFITDEGFEDMANLETVPQAVDYLKKHPSYGDIFSNIDENALHRGQIEKLLMLSLYQDFTTLYRFSAIKQRNFLNLFFIHYEISIIKRCLRVAYDHRQFNMDLSMFQSFFEKHSKIDFIKLSTSTTLDEFVLNLKDSIFYPTLNMVSSLEKPTFFDYESNLDLFYFKTIWKEKDKYLSRQESIIISECYGYKLDMLNMQWIYRSKKYYNLSASSIYALLIPVNYRLPKNQITKLVEANSIEDFEAIMKTTFYGKIYSSEDVEYHNMEDIYTHMLDKVHKNSRRKNPFSVACLNSYLYFKEEELHKIITTIEGIRYGLAPNDIISYVITE